MSESGATIDAEARIRGMLRKREFPAAIALLQSELERDPSDFDLLELLGMAYFFSSQNELARDTFLQLTRSDPMRTNAWVNLGAVLNRIGDHKHAADALRRALQRDRKCAIAYYNLGIAQRGLQQNTMAISAYKEAIRVRPDLTDASMNLGKIYMEMNNFGLAQRCFNDVLKHDPNCEKARRLLEKLQQSQKSSRKSTSPFGRLVDEKALAAAQVQDTPRSLLAAARNEERDLCRGLAKTIRAHVRTMVPVLDQNLQGVLQKLAVGSLQGDSRTHDPAVSSLLAQTRLALQQEQQQVVELCCELREHLKQSQLHAADPAS